VRRSLIITVAAAVGMVLLAMLVPMAVLLRSYALEDRLLRAALEVQATESVVSGSNDEGAVAVYVDLINRGDSGIVTTVLYPPSEENPDGLAIGPNGEQDDRVVEARATGQARVDDVDGGAQILVPVSLGGISPTAQATPVVRIDVSAPGLDSGILRSWVVLFVLGLVLLSGALVLADRLGRSFVSPIRTLAAHAQRLGEHPTPEPVTPSGPPEVRELATAMNRLVERIEVLLTRERESVADLSHRLRTPMTSLRLRTESLDDPLARERLGTDLDRLQTMVDHVVREARRSEREGLVAACDGVQVIGERAAFWRPLAEDTGRAFTVDTGTAGTQGPVMVRASAEDLRALVDVLLDNVFTHTPDDAAVEIGLALRPGGGLVLRVADAGPGVPADLDVTGRGASGAGSTGLGLAIVDRTAREAGGSLRIGTSRAGGAEVVVELGPAG
jgi:signal transduction histidine kinase